jgi:hypothetical protein
LALVSIHLAGCGSDPSPAPGSRIARQELRDASGTLTQFWLYEYDAAGQAIRIRAFSGPGAMMNVATPTWAAGLRTRTVWTDAVGNLMYTTTYDYVGGVLDRATTAFPSGIGDGYVTYVFTNGKKQTSSRYLKDGTLQSWNGFTYDAASGRRLGGTSHAASGAVTGSSTRTYVDGQLVSVQILDGSGAASGTRSFTYEPGPLAFDYDELFEF